MFLFAGMAVYHLCTWSPQGQKRASDLLELKLWAVVSYHLIARCWGWNPGEKSTLFLNSWTISPAPGFRFFRLWTNSKGSVPGLFVLKFIIRCSNEKGRKGGKKREKKKPRELCISLNTQIILTSSGKLHSRISHEVNLNSPTFQFKNHEFWAGKSAQPESECSVHGASIKARGETQLHRLVLWPPRACHDKLHPLPSYAHQGTVS